MLRHGGVPAQRGRVARSVRPSPAGRSVVSASAIRLAGETPRCYVQRSARAARPMRLRARAGRPATSGARGGRRPRAASTSTWSPPSQPPGKRKSRATFEMPLGRWPFSAADHVKAVPNHVSGRCNPTLPQSYRALGGRASLPCARHGDAAGGAALVRMRSMVCSVSRSSFANPSCNRTAKTSQTANTIPAVSNSVAPSRSGR